MIPPMEPVVWMFGVISLMGLVLKLGNHGNLWLGSRAHLCTLKTWNWREGEKAEKQPHVGLLVHPEARFTLILASSSLLKPSLLSEVLGKPKTMLVVHHREGCLKKRRMHCQGYKEAMREWARSEMHKALLRI